MFRQTALVINQNQNGINKMVNWTPESQGILAELIRCCVINNARHHPKRVKPVDRAGMTSARNFGGKLLLVATCGSAIFTYIINKNPLNSYFFNFSLSK
jgi:hypothetical protein